MISSKAQILLKIPLACLAAFVALASIFIFPLFYSTRTKPTPVIARKISVVRLDNTVGTQSQSGKAGASRRAPARLRASPYPSRPQVKSLVKPPKIQSPTPTKAFIRVPQIELPVQQAVVPSSVPIFQPLEPTQPIVSPSSDFALDLEPQFPQFSISQTDLPSQEGGDTPLASSLRYPPTPIRQKKPIYPLRYSNQGIGGFVVAQFTVKASGDVDAISITESSPEGIFDDSAKQAIATWKFTPGRDLAGEPIDCIVQIRLDFEVVSR